MLIQFGEGDALTRQKWPERWAKELPNNRLILLPHVRHFTFEGAPEATVENFRSWWTETFAMRSVNATESALTIFPYVLANRGV